MKKDDRGFLDKINKKFDDLFGSHDSDDSNDLFDIDNLDNTIVLNDENGKEVEFEFLDLLEYNGDEYVVLLPKDDSVEEVVILKVDESDNEDEEAYSSVDDEETLQIVFNIFKEKFKDEFNFID